MKFWTNPKLGKRLRTRQRSTIRHPQPRRFQPLEARMMMAGDVTAYLDGYTLRIEGDGEANHIEVRQLSNGNISIEKTEPNSSRLPADYHTRVNGGFSDVLPGQFNSISISMNGNDDSLKLIDMDVAWDLTINLGSGADDLDVYNVLVGDDLRVYTGGAPSNRSDVVDIYNVEVGTATSNADLVVDSQNNGDREVVYVRNTTVADDLFLLLSHTDTENDSAFVYNDVQVNGLASNGTTRIDSNYLYLDDFSTYGSGDFRFVNTLYAYDSYFSSDLSVTGTQLDDVLKLTNLSVGYSAEVEALDGDDKVEIHGGQAFTIDGGGDRDEIIGGSGNDIIFGGSGDDILKGGAGVDQLFGEADNDWLEAGSAAELAVGGSGQDWNAHRFDDNGATFDDINQNTTPTCVILSSLSAVARIDGSDFLLDKISYLGNYEYEVRLFDASGVLKPQTIEFDGTLYGWEPSIDAEGESWVILFQRAYLQSKGLDYTVQAQATGTAAGENTATIGQPLTMLTGRTSNLYYTSNRSVNPSAIVNAVKQGKRVLVGTKGAGQVKEQLVNNHAYTVIDEDLTFDWKTRTWQGTVTLRNPWGVDGGQSTDSVNDGVIVVDIDVLWSSIAVVTTN
ncbi:C2 family cysteine protease [Roseimaritima ulvae]|uniref:Bifunctional hemolysin/adenylate cyclase n=1 Tax=Roseimaritima ulvae TaxID=980254 RepID=A0A5B9QJM4_9BACT|nr:C2 family cysteine protease [Roseimaritima ulvae]QEG38169.1 Bifunctional hemolysin/adenylate cyclase precursor [Roseimaritima ulvae]